MTNKKQLYEQIMSCIAKEVKKYLNENNIELLADLDDSDLDQLDSIQAKTINNKLRYDNAARNTAKRLYSELREDFVNFIYVKDDHFCISFNGADRDIDKKYKYVIGRRVQGDISEVSAKPMRSYGFRHSEVLR